MNRKARTTVLILAVGVAGIQLMRPERTNAPEQPGETLQSRAPMDPQAAAVFDRSCADCHSNRTRWPWYSQVAPVSWFVADHVNHARSHLNVSSWSQYKREDAAELLEDMCEEVREAKMPLPSYLWIHRGSRMSPQDVEAICAWSKAAGAALAEPVSAGETHGEEEAREGREERSGHRH